MSDRCTSCSKLFKPRMTKDKIELFNCKPCAEKKRETLKLKEKIRKFMEQNSFKKYIIQYIEDNEQNPEKIIIDFTKERK